MGFFIDGLLIQKIKKDNQALDRFLNFFEKINNNQLTDSILFNWSSLIYYLDLESLFKNFPAFDHQSRLFNVIQSMLTIGVEKELLIEMYDQLFAECLTQVQNIPEIQPGFLINQIQKMEYDYPNTFVRGVFSTTLQHYEKQLRNEPQQMRHNLVLYLAWDRMCVNLALIFESIAPHQPLKVLSDLKIWQACLIESFQHITKQKRTKPSLFRLIETLYAYQMREENLQKYTDSEWLILCQSARILRQREEVINVFYIDEAVFDKNETKKNQEIKIITLDSPERVKDTVELAEYLNGTIKKDQEEWPYLLNKQNIISIRETPEEFIVS